MNQRTVLVTAAVLGALGVILGASGAHGLKPMLLVADKLDTYELANRYQFYHVFALLACGLLMNFFPAERLGRAALFFVIGIALFSGSLYAMCFVQLSLLGPLTPVGGVFFILGWVWMATGLKKK